MQVYKTENDDFERSTEIDIKSLIMQVEYFLMEFALESRDPTCLNISDDGFKHNT